FEPINQIGRARNTGAAAATGKWLLFVDADSQPSPELFAAAAEAMESGQVIAGGTTVRLQGGGWILPLLAGSWNLVSRWGRWLAGSFIFVERSVFEELGGFNSEMFAAEEIDLTKRLRPLARRRRQRIVILYRTPLETSARKAHLYSSRELLGFLFRSVLRPAATVTRREACSPWYDGRR
ncbi:MAG TPA: glycosyl transferase, partial [Verrucomicrobiales bacterium]|nr:glycosyl transferase [Verrucomicrobiales bacterium]